MEENKKLLADTEQKYEEGRVDMDSWADFVRSRFQKMAESKKEVAVKMGIALVLRDSGTEAFLNAKNIFNRPYRAMQFAELVQGWIDEISENYPEITLKGNTEKDKDANEKAKGIERVLAEIDDNSGVNAIKMERTEDAAIYGTGILHERYNPELIDENGEKGNLETVRIDPRDFFVDECATTIEKARDCIVRNRMPRSEFLETYKDFDINKVSFLAKDKAGNIVNGEDGFPKYFSKDEIASGKADGGHVHYVVVYDYWNRDIRKRYVVANDKVIYDEEIVSLDFSVDYYLKWNTSFWGVGVIEKCAPEVFALDIYTELAFKNAKMAMQPVIVGNQEAGFHTDLKMAPGAIWSLPGMGDHKINEVFQEIRLGGIPAEFFSFHQTLQDNLTKSSQIDQRALMANPNQLATQTRAKKESFQKRARSILRRTLWAAERRRMQIRVRLLKKYIVALNRSYEIKGFFVIRGDKENPTFIRESVASGNFKPTKENTEVAISISIQDASKKQKMDDEQLNHLSVAINSAITLKQIDPEEGKKINILGMFEMMLESMGLDKTRIYTDYKGRGNDDIADEHMFLACGGVVELPAEESRKTSFFHIREHLNFLRAEGKNLSSEAMKNTLAHIEQTWNAVLYDTNGKRIMAPMLAPEGENAVLWKK